MPYSEPDKHRAVAGLLRRLLVSSLRALVSVVVALLLAEAGLRLGGVRFDGSFYTSDLYTGWRLRPNAEGWETGERMHYAKINSQGRNDRAHPPAKRNGVLRIAVLGDSETAALNVGPDDTSCAVLERSINACEAIRPRVVEVFNFGVPGFNIAQMDLLLRHEVWNYSPDVILLQFFSGNGLMNNRRELNNASSQQAPYHVFRNGRLELDESFRSFILTDPNASRRHDQVADIMNQVRLLGLGNAARISVRNLRAPRGGTDQRALKYGPDFQTRLFYVPPAHPEIEESWRLAEAGILSMRDQALSHGAQFWLAVDAAHAQGPNFGLAGDLPRWGDQHLLYPEMRLSTLATREHFPVVILSDFLQDYARRRRAFLSGWPEGQLGSGHLNEAGHRTIGEYLGARLCPSLARSSPLAPDPAGQKAQGKP